MKKKEKEEKGKEEVLCNNSWYASQETIVSSAKTYVKS